MSSEVHAKPRPTSAIFHRTASSSFHRSTSSASGVSRMTRSARTTLRGAACAASTPRKAARQERARNMSSASSLTNDE
eukprot:1255350-Prymnesium_polylepis.2